jgi:chemosensory pili system protein ChpC
MVQKTTYIHSQILSLEGDPIILPNTAVAEIINYSDPTPVDNSPEWLLGTMEWRGIRIPLMSLEAAMGKNMPATSSSNHIAILNSISDDDSLNFYAIVTGALPRLVNLDEKKITAAANDDSEELVLSNVLVNKSAAIIPDLNAIEDMVKSTGLKNSRIS